MCRKFGLPCKGTIFWTKVLLTVPSNVLPKKKIKCSNVRDSLKVMRSNPGDLLKCSQLYSYTYYVKKPPMTMIKCPFEISWPLVLLFVVSDSWKSALRLAFSFLETCQIRYSVGRCKRTVPSKGSKRGLAKLDRTFIAPRLVSHCIAYTSVNDY